MRENLTNNKNTQVAVYIKKEVNSLEMAFNLILV